MKKFFEIQQLDPKSSHKAAAMAFPTSCVLAEPPMSAVRGAPLWGANTFSISQYDFSEQINRNDGDQKINPIILILIGENKNGIWL